MKKKLLSVLLALSLMLTLLPAAALAASYSDTAAHWAESSIERWSDYGIIQGNNGAFLPDNNLTRAHMATILAKLLKLPAAESAGFTDVDSAAWYADAVNRCAAAGIMLGNAGKANPNTTITRAQAIVMLGRALGITPKANADLSGYEDAAAVPDYAKGYVAAMSEAGIVKGSTETTVAPASDITRAATVTILDRAIEVYANESGKTVNTTGSGIVLVVADDVTINGTAKDILVAQGADASSVYLEHAPTASVTITAEEATVYVKNSTVKEASIIGEESKIVFEGESKAETVTVSESAKGAQVVINEGAKVETVANKAEDTVVTGSGTVGTVKSSEDVKVETKNTKVENTSETKDIAVTDSKGKETTVETKTESTGTTTTETTINTQPTGGGHSHSYSTAWKYNETEHWHAATCGHDVTSGRAEHTFDASYTDKGDGTHSKVCTVCSYTVQAERHSFTNGECVCGAKDAVAVINKGEGTGFVYYDSLEAAVTAAQSGETVILLKDCNINSEIAITKDITIDLNEKTVSNLKSGSNPFAITECDVTIKNGSIVIPETNTGAFGLIKLIGTNNDVTATLDGLTLIGDTDNGALVTIIPIPSNRVATLNMIDVDSSTNYRAQMCITSAGEVHMNITGGTYESGMGTFLIDSGDEDSTVVFDGVKATSENGPIIEVPKATGIFRDCDFHITGQHDPEFYSVTIGVSNNGTANIESGKYVSDHSDAIKVYSSGGSFNISGGTFVGGLNVNFSYADTVITGGVFDSDPSDYVVPGFEAKGNIPEEGKWTVSCLFAGGTGTESDPFLIGSTEQFKHIALFNDNSAALKATHFKLVNDIKTIDEFVCDDFCGSIDGQGYKLYLSANGPFKQIFGYSDGSTVIKNITIVQTGDYIRSLFGHISYAGSTEFNKVNFISEGKQVKKIGYGSSLFCMNVYKEAKFIDVTINVNYSIESPGYAGIFVGNMTQQNSNSDLTFKNCTINSTITGAYVSLFVGNPTRNTLGTVVIDNVKNNGTIIATEKAEYFSTYNNDNWEEKNEDVEILGSVTKGNMYVCADLSEADISLSDRKIKVEYAGENSTKVTYSTVCGLSLTGTIGGSYYTIITQELTAEDAKTTGFNYITKMEASSNMTLFEEDCLTCNENCRYILQNDGDGYKAIVCQQDLNNIYTDTTATLDGNNALVNVYIYDNVDIICAGVNIGVNELISTPN